MNKNKGFTLIELLVVIAIIGILASVVLASLNSARAKGKDAAIKSQLSSMRADAELIYDSATPNSYSSVCNTGSSSKKLFDAAVAQSASGSANACVSSIGTAWGAFVTLNAAAVKYCVDSSGFAGTAANGLNITTGLCN